MKLWVDHICYRQTLARECIQNNRCSNVIEAPRQTIQDNKSILSCGASCGAPYELGQNKGAGSAPFQEVPACDHVSFA